MEERAKTTADKNTQTTNSSEKIDQREARKKELAAKRQKALEERAKTTADKNTQTTKTSETNNDREARRKALQEKKLKAQAERKARLEAQKRKRDSIRNNK